MTLLRTIERVGVRLQEFTGVPHPQLVSLGIVSDVTESPSPKVFHMPWMPPAEIVRVDGRGEFFVRRHQHPDPAAPTVMLLHGWTASADLQFFTAYRGLAEHYSFIGIDHRGHGRGLRTLDRSPSTTSPTIT